MAPPTPQLPLRHLVKLTAADVGLVVADEEEDESEEQEEEEEVYQPLAVEAAGAAALDAFAPPREAGHAASADILGSFVGGEGAAAEAAGASAAVTPSADSVGLFAEDPLAEDLLFSDDDDDLFGDGDLFGEDDE